MAIDITIESIVVDVVFGIVLMLVTVEPTSLSLFSLTIGCNAVS